MHPCSPRAFSRTSWETERGAAPAGGARNLAPGRPGTPTEGHYDPSARSSQSARERGAMSADPGPKIAAMERRKAPVARKGHGKTNTDAPDRRSIPSIFRGGRKRKAACPGPFKNTGDDACLIPPPKGEGGE